MTTTPSLRSYIESPPTTVSDVKLPNAEESETLLSNKTLFVFKLAMITLLCAGTGAGIGFAVGGPIGLSIGFFVGLCAGYCAGVIILAKLDDIKENKAQAAQRIANYKAS